jgi:hypothetical protein
MSKEDKERNRIKDEFDQIQSENDDYDFEKHLAKGDDLPDLGEIEIYDYDSDLTVSSHQSMDVLETLVDLYLGDVPKLKEHPYIKTKMKEDAMVYAEALFLTKMTRKNFLTQMRQVDNGDSSARMHEVVNQTIGQIRENAKFLSGQKTELEKFYKTLRKDLGYNEIENTEIKSVESAETTDGSDINGGIMSTRDINDMIKLAMLNKKDEQANKKK